MRLVHPDGWYLALTIAGYQFPHLASEDYDSNWLNVAIDVKHPRGRWSAVDAAFLTYEVASLAQWMSDIASGRRQEHFKRFLEPCLSFGLSRDLHGTDELVVEFWHSFQPPWAGADLDMREHLAFPLAELNLPDASTSLRRQLSLYPQRAER